jgi:hypothetical protein
MSHQILKGNALYDDIPDLRFCFLLTYVFHYYCNIIFLNTEIPLQAKLKPVEGTIGISEIISLVRDKQ